MRRKDRGILRIVDHGNNENLDKNKQKKRENMKPATILDIDGTLIDVRPALHYLLGENPDKPAFFAETVQCPAHLCAIEYAKKHHDNGQKIIIITSRREKYRHHTMAWLEKNLPVPYDLLLMSGNDDSSDIEIKKKILNQVIDLGYQPTHAIDDTLDILHLWHGHGIEVTPMPILRDLAGNYPLDAATVWQPGKLEKISLKSGHKPQLKR